MTTRQELHLLSKWVAEAEEAEMTVYVRYRVPVMVEVDLPSRRVARVVVDEHSRALEIASADMWPAWEFGG